jgi:gliding motility-associated peptidyl-prolyl isomerase
MKISNLISVLMLLVSVVACKQPEARKPISQSSGSFMKESIDRNKKLVASEEQNILNIIKKDSLSTYINSNKGYWYAYVTKSAETVSPVRGDITKFEYDVTDINGNIIYTREETKPQTYVVEKQEMMSGIQNGIKLMHKGDVVKFIFPSNIAYGYHGDDKKIGPNQPIICTVTLNDIKKEITSK